MINVDDRLLPKIDSNEMWFLLHLAKRINTVEKVCWPSNATLCIDTGWHIEKVQKIKKALMKKRLISVEIRPDKSNIYRVCTGFLGVYINLENIELVEIEPNGKTDIPENQVSGISGTGRGVKSDSKVLTNEVLKYSTNVDSQKSGLGAELELSIEVPNSKGPKKDAKPRDAVYHGFCEIWAKNFPNIGFKFPRDGAKIKSLIDQCKTIMARSGIVTEDEKVIEFFDIAIANLPAWYRGKTLPVIDSHFPTIIDDITNGKKRITKNNGDRFSDFAGVAG